MARVAVPCSHRRVVYLNSMLARPSRTALRVALRRAAHQLVDHDPLVFTDPLAVSLLGRAHTEELRRTPTHPDRLHSRALRAWIVARSRFAEDTLATAVASGVTQYVLLGAGLDTFGHRNPYPRLHVFEVDHPATQQWKRNLLVAAAISSPARLTCVPVDFEQNDLVCELTCAGFDTTRQTLFACLGVVPYLTLPAFRATMDFVAGQPHGSGILFDYGQPRSALPPLEQLEHDSLAERVALAGEPFQLFFTPDTLRAELTAFAHIQDLGREEINALYFNGRSDQLRILGTAGRLVKAVL